MFKFVGLIFCGALLFLTGCATPPSAPVPQVWSAAGGASNAVPSVAGPANITGVAINQPPGLTMPVRPAQGKPTNGIRPPSPVTTWTSVSSWATEHNLEKPERLTDSPMATYAMISRNGEMIFSLGSRAASWNGREVNLGFDPEMIDGEVFMHGLDLQKNLEPLLCEKPLTFGGEHVIVLDPGHGGTDNGTISVLDHRPEKEFTLDLAKRIKPLLEQEGWKVYLTRTIDCDVSHSNRVSFAESHQADLFISLHFNSAAPDKKQAGLETYCLTPTGMPSTLTRNYADPWQENLPNNNFDAQNLQLAVHLHTALLRANGEEDRGVRRARFISVLRGQNRPAILIEGGYLSNPAEAAKIENPEFRQKLAETIAAALVRNPQMVIHKPELMAVQVHTNTVTQ
ncbi:MAG: N-acetylmuramoyl-L-alanine amidase [Verrucomicrobiota bacterium]